jgi:hypothetical protein
MVSKINLLYKKEARGYLQSRIKFGNMELPKDKLSLRVFSINIEELQESLIGYCNITGVDIMDCPALDVTLLQASGYRSTELPCEAITACENRTFLDIETEFKVIVRKRTYFGRHYISDSEDESINEMDGLPSPHQLIFPVLQIVLKSHGPVTKEHGLLKLNFNMPSNVIHNVTIFHPTSQNPTSGPERESHRLQPDSANPSHPNDSENLNSPNGKHVIKEYHNQGNNLGASSDHDVSKTRPSAPAQSDQKRTTDQKVPETVSRRDKPPNKLPLGSKNVSSVNGRKEWAIYKIPHMRLEGACPTTTPCMKEISGHTSPKGITGEVAGVASFPTGLWKRGLKNRRRIPEGTDLTLKFEAVNEKPSQEAPGSVPASVVPSRKTPVIRLPSNKPIRRPNPISCPPDKSDTKAKEAVSPRSHEATNTCETVRFQPSGLVCSKKQVQTPTKPISSVFIRRSGIGRLPKSLSVLAPTP